jgi:asparagine N-glycosylation enzyme membrane subunit Stt3
MQVCVFTAPLFSAFTALAAYGFVREVRGDSAGVLAAAFVGIVPSYISRSVAGSYDLEAVAIFALLFVFYLFVKARRGCRCCCTVHSGARRLFLLAVSYVTVKSGCSQCAAMVTAEESCMAAARLTFGLPHTCGAADVVQQTTSSCDCLQTLNTGSLAWAIALCGAYAYMAVSWGGYTFIINLLPIYCLVAVASGRLTSRLYVAFAPIVAIGTLLAASIPVIGFNAVTTSEHFGAFLAFAVLHGAIAVSYIRRLLPPREFRAAAAALVGAGAALGAAVGVAVVLKMLASPTFGWTGRSLSLLDPTYAARYIPIIASVSEHQPPTWNAYFMDIQAMVALMPVGFILCFLPLTDGSLFLVLYGATAVYFSGVMVRLMLVLAPAACCLAAVGTDAMFRAAAAGIHAKPDLPGQGPALTGTMATKCAAPFTELVVCSNSNLSP